jgi:ATP-binding cassette, subfamily B, bacterial PglK
MFNIVRKLIDLLSSQEKKEALIIVLMSIIMALFDVIGVASIMPFMAVLTSPSLVETNPFLSFIYIWLDFKNTKDFLYFLGVVVFLTLLISLLFKALTLFMMTRFTTMREFSISRRLFRGYLYQPYIWYLSRNSASLSKTILSEVQAAIGGALMPIMNLIAQVLVTLALISLLILANSELAMIVGGTIASTYIIIYFLMTKFLSKIGSNRVIANEARFTIASEAFGGIKDIKVGHLEEAYLNRFSVPAKTYAKSEAAATIASSIPRYFLEILAFGGIVLLILSLMSEADDFNSVVPIISLYAFAGYRLMPAMQQIFGSATQLKYADSILEVLHSDFKMLDPLPKKKYQGQSVFFRDFIQLKNIEFNYPQTKKNALNEINIKISVNNTIGIIGSTGSGKTTLVDLILGLIRPTKGTFEVDGIEINSLNFHDWQKLIGYVPQQIFLADDSISANIAFGVDPSEVNQNQVEVCASIANLHEFIVQDLPEAYETKVGERGIRLSGGQRQRIGIARALYSNPKVLILDEATSALDNITENLVMQAVYNLSRQITIIIIAHRLSTVEKCDKIFIMENGQVVDQGNFSSLLKNSKKFQKMTNL